MSVKKRILILGVGSAQSDAIAFLKDQGHYVIGISNKNEGLAVQLVDEFKEIDIIDKGKVLSFAKDMAVDLVYSIGSDLAMPTIGFVSSKLNLPTFVTEEIAILSQDKVLFRSFLSNSNICKIKFLKATKFSDLSDWNVFPAIMKPADSQGQRGVVKVMGMDDLREKFTFSLSHSRSKTVIIEQFIDGKEVSVNGYMYKGELVYLFMSDRRVIEGFTGGLVKGHDFPTSMPILLQPEARRLALEVAIKLNYINGPFYFQMIYNEEKVFIIEGTPRFDGCHLWRLIEERFNINLLDIAFNHLLDDEIHFEPIVEPLSIKNSIEFFVQKPGTTFESSDYFAEKSNGGYFELYYQNGEKVRPINGEMEKVGYQIISSKLQ